MAWTLACQASDRIAAAAPTITGMLEHQRDLCQPARLVPLLAIAGTEDWTDGAHHPRTSRPKRTAATTASRPPLLHWSRRSRFA